MKSLIAFFFIAFIIESSAASYFSRKNGSWGDSDMWSLTNGGSACNCFPKSSDNISVLHAITLDRHLINQGSNQNGITGVLTIVEGTSLDGGNTYDVDIRSTGTLDLCGTLIARNTTLSNGSVITSCPSGNLVVNNTFTNNNNSTHQGFSATITVYGPYINGNGAVINGSGSITVVNGPVTNTGNTFGCQGFNPCGSYPCTIASPCGSGSLSVSLLSFKVVFDNTGRFNAEWCTGYERNNSYFAIDYSDDDVTYHRVFQMEGRGNSSKEYCYNESLDYITCNSEALYFRLSQVDIDGETTVYEPVTASCPGQPHESGIFPNPLVEKEELGVKSMEYHSYSLLNVYGEKVVEGKIQSEGANGKIKTLANLEDGLYYLVLFNDTNRTQEKVIIKN